MPSWKKVITSGSNAALNHITSSGNVSGSLSSTGSFGRVEASTVSFDNVNTNTLTGTSGDMTFDAGSDIILDLSLIHI